MRGTRGFNRGSRLPAGLALFAHAGQSGNYLTEALPAVLVLTLGLAIMARSRQRSRPFCSPIP